MNALSINDLQLVIDRQKALGKRLIWLTAVPFVMTAALVYMFLRIDSHVSDIELTENLINVESKLSRDNNYAWAINEYEAIAKSHRSAPVLARLGELYFLADQNDSGRALATLIEANNVDPKSWEPYRELAFVYTSIDKPKEAIEAGEKAIKLNSFDANTYNNLAWVHSHSKDSQYRDLNEALRDASYAVRYTKEKHVEYLDTLAQVYIQFGDPQSKSRAFEVLKKAALIAPNNRKGALIKDLQDNFPEEKLNFSEEKLEAEK
jgi:tetratricopeptide (TPR) repeat protein